MENNGMMGFQPIPIGSYMKPVGIERLRLNDGQSEICSIISAEAYTVHVHYDEELRMLFHCFKGQCCIENAQPQDRYVVPVLCYSGTKESYGPPYTLKYLIMGKMVYERLCKKRETCQQVFKSDINLCDIEVICENGNFQTFNFEIINKDALYRMTEPNLGQDLVRSFMDDWNALAFNSIAKPMNEQKFMELRAAARDRQSMANGGYGQNPNNRLYGGQQQPRYGQQQRYGGQQQYQQRQLQQPQQQYGGGYNNQQQYRQHQTQAQIGFTPSPSQLAGTTAQVQPIQGQVVVQQPQQPIMQQPQVLQVQAQTQPFTSQQPAQPVQPQQYQPAQPSGSDMSGVDIDALVANPPQQTPSPAADESDFDQIMGN